MSKVNDIQNIANLVNQNNLDPQADLNLFLHAFAKVCQNIQVLGGLTQYIQDVGGMNAIARSFKDILGQSIVDEVVSDPNYILGLTNFFRSLDREIEPGIKISHLKSGLEVEEQAAYDAYIREELFNRISNAGSIQGFEDEIASLSKDNRMKFLEHHVNRKLDGKDQNVLREKINAYIEFIDNLIIIEENEEPISVFSSTSDQALVKLIEEEWRMNQSIEKYASQIKALTPLEQEELIEVMLNEYSELDNLIGAVIDLINQ